MYYVWDHKECRDAESATHTHTYIHISISLSIVMWDIQRNTTSEVGIYVGSFTAPGFATYYMYVSRYSLSHTFGDGGVF